LPGEAGVRGGFMVAGVNFAIGRGAGIGGAMWEFTGPRGVFLASGVILVVAVVTIAGRVRPE